MYIYIMYIYVMYIYIYIIIIYIYIIIIYIYLYAFIIYVTLILPNSPKHKKLMETPLSAIPSLEDYERCPADGQTWHDEKPQTSPPKMEVNGYRMDGSDDF